jgi:peptide/nickel transport system substrate-binding protein
MNIKTVTPADLFAKIAPTGDFELALYTLVDTYPDPTLSSYFLSTNAPSEANGYSGINFGHVDVPGLDDLLTQVDNELDQTKRIAASKQADEVIGQAVPSLPVQIVPAILLWSDKVGGPLSINPVQGPFWNLAEWGQAQ